MVSQIDKGGHYLREELKEALAEAEEEAWLDNGAMEGLGDEYDQKQAKINVTDQYLASLPAKLKIKLSGAGTKAGRGKAKIQFLNLEHAESGDDDFDEGLGLMEKERKRLAELQAK
ncbi:hypothetical protein B0H14DRAFT_2643411 [Mycena olivaceomarginata]|nr:hypothetical protein B0H14DRAFT_2643411 [Mycena olivaceomarginata]